MTRIIAIRPEPGLAATIAEGADLGLEISGYPLSEIRPCSWELPDLTQIDGLLIGSANALRHGGRKLAELRHVPVFAVGEATAQQARELGFDVAQAGEGGLQQLLGSMDDRPRHLLRLAGEAHVPLNLPPQITLTTRIAYRVVDNPIPAEMAQMLRDPCLILLHSAGAASHFLQECERLGLSRAPIALAALGPRILVAAGEGWRDARAAPNPCDSALLAMVRDMCH